MEVHNSLVYLALFIGTVLAARNGNDNDGSYEHTAQRLRRLLFQERNYDATSRPTNSTSEPTVIKASVVFKSIMHVRGESDWFTGVLWLGVFWHDHRLTWNKEEYDDIVYLDVHKSQIWSPEVDLLNVVSQDFDSWIDWLTIDYNGTVWAYSTAKFKLPCPVGGGKFQTDEQVCTIRMASDTYGSNEVTLVEGKFWVELQTAGNTEWDLTKMSYANHTEFNRSFLDVSFHLRRFAKRHRYAVNVPLVAVTLVMLSAFWMPPGSDRRLTLVGLNFLVVAIMLDRTTTLLGLSVATSNTFLFLGTVAVVQVVTAAGNIFALNLLSSRTGVKVPDVLHRALSGTAGTVLCLNIPEQETSVRPRDVMHPLTFDDSQDRRRRWLLLAQAVDRLLFIVFGFTAIGLLA
ncbi:acetylcholine receptor subunit alpha-type acr-16-like isoform X2 [Dermacentor andersoni]|uniref:acetylcholine receptor subunit alpha-type acr-16-like isoform X2 n=1 Tax=Dermacentor andersoni TaxID=34620 RepID=UPI002155D629|nr:acetylcholine receptor subunit alpha-type acr-16-like isoform X2 [Dermacentor andersoni]